MHWEDREWFKKNQHKIGEANGILNLPIVPTQVTLMGNVGSLDAPVAAQLFTFGHRGQGNALREGHEWSKKLANIGHVKVKEQSFCSNNFILLNHIQVCFITIYDGCLT